MLEDEQKLRLITAAVKLQDIIATLEMDLEYQTLIDIYGYSTKTLQDEVQALEVSNEELQVARDVTLQSQLNDYEVLFISLNQTIYDMAKLVGQINNNQH
jgi:hypothetical protein